MASRRAQRMRVLRATSGTWALVAAVAASSCVIAESPSDLPVLPDFRPTILHGSTVPSSSAVLGAFPDKFVVPVELVDPTVPFDYRSYIDYNPITGEGNVQEASGTSLPSGVRARVRILEVGMTPPADLDRCHVIEVLVALRFRDTIGQSSHTPVEPGGDSVTWIYSPTGDLRGCPVLDAGLPPPVDGGPGGDAGGS